MPKQSDREEAATSLAGRPGVTTTVEESNNRTKITIGIKNSFPVEAPGNRWTSISPFVSISREYENPPDSLLEEVTKLYNSILPAYGYLLLQENAKVLEVASKEKSIPQLALELLEIGED